MFTIRKPKENIDTRPKREQSADLEKQIQDFIAQGNKIEVLPYMPEFERDFKVRMGELSNFSELV